ncbi:MarR family winged helix-turn-helix transcriptional regulator [Chitinophaga eiseniae]|uniref:MarR family transcriptional regulator n=1 Tax=Chitinophaga eiseniae TaxID=634771 RepID=A0A847SC77_9BACT|nr:MarR family transcriptional regulator [Chitinophaga eiseniae]NLR77343.1 MarR family transcriptional regulator [Chitinophaga eiseniae]
MKLISAWETYTKQHPGTSATEFCMYFLAKESNSQLFSGLTPPDLDTVFAKLIGRLAGMQTAYSKMALQEIPEFELDWFYFLNSIYHLKEVKKTQIIQYNFTEQTTGIDILNRLKKQGYITERTDPEDKRAKLVSLTKAGEKILFKLYQLLHKPTLLMYSDLDDKDKQVVINLLKDTEQKHQEVLSNAKNKTIDELLTAALGTEKMAQITLEQQKKIAAFSGSKRHDKHA